MTQPARIAAQAGVASPRALCVDLDGSLILTDTLHESLVLLVKQAPWLAFLLPLWILRGKAYCKRRIASAVRVDPATLPYRSDLLAWLRKENERGIQIYLVTASDHSVATAVASHLGIFQSWWGSDGKTNLSGNVKSDHLVRLFGEKGFDYVGNSTVDLGIWQRAQKAIIAGARPGLIDAARRLSSVGHIFPSDTFDLRTVFEAMRVRQWVKNVLVFAVIPTSHRALDLTAWRPAALSFLALSFCASAFYIVNDLLDLETDRRHATKRKRPFSSGALPVWTAGILVPLLLSGSVICAWPLPRGAQALVLIYPVVSAAYSFYLKRRLLVDVFTLALLYALRVLLGGAATGSLCSAWLMAFSIFVFLSLALAKRASELRDSDEVRPAGRAYVSGDLNELHLFGVASSFAAGIVLALYIRSDQVLRFYVEPNWLWAAVIAILYWECRMWVQVHRGELGEDGILFASRDRVSYGVALVVAASLALATYGRIRIPGLMP